MTLMELLKREYDNDPEYRMIVDAIRAGYRGIKHPFVLSLEYARRFLKEVKE